MRRVLFNAEDLAKLAVRPWGPFAEALFSLRQLQQRQTSYALAGWRREARHKVGPGVAPLLVIAPSETVIDLQTVVGEAAMFDESMDRLEGADVAHVRSELEYLPPPPSNGAWARVWVQDLMDGNRRARQELVSLLRDYHRAAVAPHWGAISAHLEAERARCGRAMARDGIDGLLAGLHPGIRWQPPWLEVGVAGTAAAGAAAVTHVLGGRSLVLVPSFFCDNPHLLRNLYDEAAPLLLAYPTLRTVADGVPLVAAPTPTHRALADLLGRTRAQALDVIAATCTTTELARSLGVSPATASHHAGILRGARLVATDRDGNSVRHRLTGLGRALLDGRHQPR